MDADDPPRPEPAPRTTQRVYVLDGVVHVPHYHKPGRWVGPGYPEVCDARMEWEMLIAGGIPSIATLWERPWTAAV